MPDPTPATSSPWPMRGIMLDAARQTESFEFYKRLIPDLARWGYNTILLHITDDQGCAVLLESPRVLPTAGALTAAQWQALARLAAEHGIEVIPEVECLGHTGFVTRLPEHAALREPPAGGGQFWSACPVHPSTLKVIGEVLKAIAGVFPGRYLHIGMDEADIGGGELTQAAMRERPLWRIFADYTAELNRIVRGLGRQSLMWGDHLLKSRDLMQAVPRDVVICNWLYGRGHSEDYTQTTRTLLDAGFEVIGCPSGCAWGMLFVPHEGNLANIADFDRACRALADDPGILGMIVTMWCPYRHLPEIGYPIMAFAARRFEGKDVGFARVVSELTRDRYGLTGQAADQAAGAITKLHEGRTRNMVELHLLRSGTSDLTAEADAIRSLMALCAEAARTLAAARGGVTGHTAEFDQWAFTATFLHDLCELRLDEIRAGGDGPSPARAALARRYFETYHRFRQHLGTGADEPALGQAPRFRPPVEDDNPAEHLAIWKR